jgi:hypothetical protein
MSRSYGVETELFARRLTLAPGGQGASGQCMTVGGLLMPIGMALNDERAATA